MKESRFFSLRYKITIAFFAIGFLTSIFLGVVAYKILEEKLFSELQRNVGNVTRMGAALLDRENLTALIMQQKDGLPQQKIAEIEDSPAYRAISGQLNFIRDTEKELIRYVYLVTPAGDGQARYLVDADVLALNAKGDNDAEISHFSSSLDIGPFPVMQRAMAERINIVEDDYVYDETFQVNTVSGYAPVLGNDGKTLLALLGLDMADIEVRAALSEVLYKSVLVAALSLGISLLTAVIVGTWFTRGIIRLDRLVQSFARKDFAVRAQIETNDEVGRLGFSFNHMAETIEDYHARLEALVAAYGRFVPHDLLRLLEKKSILDVNLGDQVQRDMAVLFSDIRDFTSISEAMSPKDNFDYINAYLREVGPEIRAHKGVIDKYIGDAVMALFPERVEDAVDAALEMQRRVRDYNGRGENRDKPPVRIGVGVHSGKVMLGTIGEDQRMDGTVISDTVNLASRLEGLTKTYGCKILVSDVVLEKLADPERYLARLVDRVRVVGKNEAVTLYEICDADDEDVLNRKRATLQEYRRAVDFFYRQDFSAAEEIFSGIVAANENDNPARLFLVKTRQLLQDGVPEGWTGVFRAGTK